MFRRYFESSVEIPGVAATELGAIARDYSVYLVIGVIERAGGTLYCTVLFFNPAGELMGKHRKLMPTAMERLIWGMGDGSTMPVFDTPLGRVGAVICWENYMPLLRTAMYSKGIELYCAPTVDDRDTWARSMQHIAFEGALLRALRCAVFGAQGLSGGLCGHADGVDSWRQRDCESAGVVLAGPHYGGETILVADLNRDELVEGKFDLDVVGHYARPDVFRLIVNEGEN